VDRHNGSSAVGVAEEVVAALDSCDLEAGLPQGCDDLTPRDSWKAESRNGDLLNANEIKWFNGFALDL
jgi:hypothetical protein